MRGFLDLQDNVAGHEAKDHGKGDQDVGRRGVVVACHCCGCCLWCYWSYKGGERVSGRVLHFFKRLERKGKRKVQW